MINSLFSIIIFFVVSFSSSWEWGISLGLLVFLVQNFKSNRWDETFITNIAFDYSNFKIEYSSKGNEQHITGETNGFKLKVKFAFNKIRTPYLAIIKDDQIILKQFEISEWTEIKMKEVVDAFNNIK